MNRELIERIDAEIVALDADIATFKNALGDDAELGAELKTLAVLKDCKAALSQEAEPVAWLDLSKMTPSGMVYATGFKANDRQTALYDHQPKPAPLSQSVAPSGVIFFELVCDATGACCLTAGNDGYAIRLAGPETMGGRAKHKFIVNASDAISAITKFNMPFRK